MDSRSDPEFEDSDGSDSELFDDEEFDDHGAESEWKDRPVYKKAHFDLLEKIKACDSRGEEPDMLQLVSTTTLFQYVDKQGDQGSTILHTFSERWGPHLRQPWLWLMERYPDLYLVEDDLGRTILDKAQDRRRESRPFVTFFAQNHCRQTAELIKGKPDILELLLETLRDVPCWNQILSSLGPELLKPNSKGNSFLHSVVQYAAEYSSPKDWLCEVARTVIDSVPEILTKVNREKKSPYQYHQSLLHAVERKESASLHPKEKLRLKRREEKREAYPKTEAKQGLLLGGKGKEKAPDGRELRRRSVQVSGEAEESGNEKRILGMKPPPLSSKAPQISKISKEQKKEAKARVNHELAIMLKLEMFQHIDGVRIPELVYAAGEEKETMLDLSELPNSEYQTSSDTINSAIMSLNFDTVLKVVRLPVFKNIDDGSDQDLLENIFESLRRKGVKYIVSLEVDEDPDRGHSDESITRCLQQFEIIEFDWRKTDLSSDIIHEIAPDSRVLRLYSSGNLGVLKSWAAHDGLFKFLKMRKVVVSVMSHTETQASIRRYQREFETRLSAGWKQNTRQLIPWEYSMEIYRPPRKQNPLSWSLVLSPGELTLLEPERPPKSWIEQLASIGNTIARKRNYSSVEVHVHVAIISDGLDITQFPGKKVAAGKTVGQSIDYSSRSSALRPWYFSSTGNGTRMAKQIALGCHAARFYVARMDPMGRHVPSIERAIEQVNEALNWAISKHVDIILLGFSLAEIAQVSDHDLEDTLRDAELRGILVLSPACEGDSNSEEFSFNQPNIFTIAATPSSDGARRTQEFLIPGTVPLSEGQHPPSSLVAAGHAAGLISLVLFCYKTCCEHPHDGGHPRVKEWQKKTSEEGWSLDPREILAILQGMSGSGLRGKSKYITLDRLVDQLDRVSDSRPPECCVVELLMQFSKGSRG